MSYAHRRCCTQKSLYLVVYKHTTQAVYFCIFSKFKKKKMFLGTNCSARHTFLKSYGRCSLTHARFYFTTQHKTKNLA